MGARLDHRASARDDRRAGDARRTRRATFARPVQIPVRCCARGAPTERRGVMEQPDAAAAAAAARWLDARVRSMATWQAQRTAIVAEARDLQDAQRSRLTLLDAALAPALAGPVASALAAVSEAVHACRGTQRELADDTQAWIAARADDPAWSEVRALCRALRQHEVRQHTRRRRARGSCSLAPTSARPSAPPLSVPGAHAVARRSIAT